jgi:hypothetical protein
VSRASKGCRWGSGVGAGKLATWARERGQGRFQGWGRC